MKVYKKILLFIMFIILSLTFITISANAESIKKYDNNFSESSSWQFIGGGNEVVYKTFVFDEGISDLAQYLSFCISNVPVHLNDFVAIRIQNYLYTYVLDIEYKVEQGVYYTEFLEYSNNEDSNIIIFALIYDYSLTQANLNELNSVWVDVWKWYSEPDYYLFDKYLNSYHEYLRLQDEIDSLLNQIAILQDTIFAKDLDIYALNGQIANLQNQISLLNIELQQMEEELEDVLEQIEEELDFAFDRGYEEAVNQINAIETIVPSAIGSIWLVISDFLSINVLGIAIWEIVGAFVAIGLALIIIRMFL